LPFKIKWPNDIYYDGQSKVAGILVKSSIFGELLSVKIGVGFNINNQHPTECLNRILREKGLSEWSNELFLAKFLNNLEPLVEQLKTVNGFNRVLNDYQENWLHS
jgi:biotin--protein ligase